MAAKYDFKTAPDVQGKKEQPTLYPQIVASGTKDLKALAKELAKRTTLHEGTVIGLFCDLEDLVAEYLADGYHVKLGELGTLSTTLKCREVTDKKEIRAASVHFDSVKFNPTRRLWLSDFLHPLLGRRAFHTACQPPKGAHCYQPQGVFRTDRPAAYKGERRTASLERQETDSKGGTGTARNVHPASGKSRVNSVPPDNPEGRILLFLPCAAGGYEIRPQQNQRQTEQLPYIKSHIHLFCNLRIFHKFQHKARAEKDKQTHSGNQPDTILQMKLMIHHPCS